ncbi:MAG TPA: TorF family putative porin [Rhodanobacteraceae bacterium]|nr:TorF family putative porin [Rhodanobacteraceae bacterium]
MKTKNLICASLLIVALPVADTALADAVNDPDYAISGNVALTSDYMFRGLTQTWGDLAIQGGADLSMKNGVAAGFWASSISGGSYPGASLELDVYASYGAAINDDWSWRAGLYGYLYPHGNLDRAGLPSRSFDTLEANAALTWKWLTLKYSSSLTDYFGIETEQGYRGDSKGTGYVQLDAAIPLDARWSLALHAGHTSIPTRLAVPLANGANDPDYDDFGAALKCQLAPHWSATLGATYADNHAFYGHTVSFTNASDTKNVGGTRGYVMLQGSF